MAAADTTASRSVLVTNISPKANEKTVSDFFSFCGKVTNLSLRSRSDGSEAIVTFEAESAAKTALLLTSALIVDRPITVVPHHSGASEFPTSLDDLAEPPSKHVQLEGDQISNRPQPNIPEELRSKTSVVASLIAAGYTVSTDAIRKAREWDEENQISQRLSSAAEAISHKMKEIDEQYQISKSVEELSEKVAEKARIVDNQFHISEKAANVSASVAGTAAVVSASVAAGVQEVQNKIQQEPALTSAWSRITATTSQIGEKISTFIAPATNAVKAEVDTIANETKTIIEEKKRERGIVDDPSTVGYRGSDEYSLTESHDDGRDLLSFDAGSSSAEGYSLGGDASASTQAPATTTSDLSSSPPATQKSVEPEVVPSTSTPSAPSSSSPPQSPTTTTPSLLE